LPAGDPAFDQRPVSFPVRRGANRRLPDDLALENVGLWGLPPSAAACDAVSVFSVRGWDRAAHVPFFTIQIALEVLDAGLCQTVHALCDEHRHHTSSSRLRSLKAALRVAK